MSVVPPRISRTPPSAGTPLFEDFAAPYATSRDLVVGRLSIAVEQACMRRGSYACEIPGTGGKLPYVVASVSYQETLHMPCPPLPHAVSSQMIMSLKGNGSVK
jgi:hypothetical protein